MDEKEKLMTAEGGTQDVQPTEKTRKDSFRERFGKKYPDLNLDDEDAYYGALNDEFDLMDKSNAEQRKLGEMLGRDPRSAGLLMVMKNGGNPMEYLIEHYGEDFRDALNDEEKAKEFAAAFAKNIEKRAESEKLRAQASSNMQAMIDALDEAQKDGSFSDENATKAFDYLYADGGLLDRILVNDIKKEDWMMLMKAENYDRMKSEGEQMAKTAHEEGVVEGRNANIDIQKKKRTQAKSMPGNVPSTGSARPAKSKDKFLSMLDEKTKSVWD